MHTATILIVEDDDAIGEGLRRTLVADGFNAFVEPDGQRALQWLAGHTPDLIIADIMMPNMNGYQLYQRVRQNPEWLWVPFIFLTARADAEDIRYGKELGVDDYLTKPIEPADLVAAVRGCLTRYDQLGIYQQGAGSQAPPSGAFQIGALSVDLSRRLVYFDTMEVALSPTEFDILQRLVIAEGAVVLYEDLLGYDDDELLSEKDAAELLRYHVRDLRQKIKAAGEHQDLIINVRSVGYRLGIKPQPLN